MRDKVKKIKENLAIGDPPRLINTFLFGSWFVIVLATSDLIQFIFLVYQPREFGTGKKWANHGFDRLLIFGRIIASNFLGRFVAALVAPMVDSYRILPHFYLASLATGCISFLTITVIAYIPSFAFVLENIILTYVMPSIMNFFLPFVVAFTTEQFKDKIGAKSRMLFTALYMALYAFKGICTGAFFPVAPRYPDIVNLCIISFSLFCAILSLAVFITIITFIRKNLVVINKYDKSETAALIGCLGRVVCSLRKGNRFERLQNKYSQRTIYETKKVIKVLALLLAMSFLMSTVEFWQLAWMHQYVLLSNRTDLFAKLEYVTVTNILLAIFIPIAQYGLVPQLRKIKFPLPLYSLLICIGYIILCFAFFSNFLIRASSKVSPFLRARYNPLTNVASYYVFNAMDTHSYISEGGVSREVLAPGSITKLGFVLGIEIRVMNFWYDVHYRKRVESYEDDLIICTRQGVYQDYLGAYSWEDGYSASHVSIPKLSFICQKDMKSGGPTDFCNDKTEFIIKRGGEEFFRFRLDNNSEPHNTTMNLDFGDHYTVSVRFHGDPLNVEARDIEFFPWQGAWYALVVWSADITLKIRYKLVTVREGSVNPTLASLPPLFLAALAFALLFVILSCLVHTNSPESIVATVWAWNFLIERLFCPCFLIVMLLGPTGLGRFVMQGVVLAMGLLCFVGLLAAIRVAGYW